MWCLVPQEPERNTFFISVDHTNNTNHTNHMGASDQIGYRLSKLLNYLQGNIQRFSLVN